MRVRLLAALAVLSLLVTVSVGTSRAGPAADAKLEKLSWLAGSWARAIGRTYSEEHWMAARGGLMVGMNRMVSGGTSRSFEFLRIQAMGDSIAYVASPNNRPPTVFPLKELGEKRVVFENPTHDFPQRVIYWLGNDGALHARVEGTMDGKAAAEDFVWARGSLAP